MSAGALAATLAVAFVGGAGGAILGPWVTHRFRTREREAERKHEPYESLLAAGRALMTATGSKPIHVEGYSASDAERDWMDALADFGDAIDAADAVSSEEVRDRAQALRGAMSAWVRAGEEIPHDVTDETFWETAKPLIDASFAAQRAYDALRDQVQRETRG